MIHSKLASLPEVPPDPLYGAKAEFELDSFPEKAFLCIGAYRTDDGKPYVLPSVLEAEQRYIDALHAGTENKEYDSIAGCKPFRDASIKLLYGPECPPLETIASCVSLSGSGALRLCGELLRHTVGPETPVYFSDPTWANHQAIFKAAGMPNVRKYRYFNRQTSRLDYDGMIADMKKMPEGAIVVLHVCSHNPTGCDPSDEQWGGMADVVQSQKLVVVFDSAYQGYASGDVDRDVYSARLFAKRGIPVMCCQSYSKNMGFYGDRLGCFSVLCDDTETASTVQAFLEGRIIRPCYSSPPRKPSRVALMVLTDPGLRQQWERELTAMSERITSMRQALLEELTALKTPGSWTHVVEHVGMFSYLGINPKRCATLIRKHHFYVLPTSRISLAGLTTKSVARFAAAIDEVVRDTELDEPKKPAAKL